MTDRGAGYRSEKWALPFRVIVSSLFVDAAGSLVRVTSGIITAVSNGEIRRFRKFQNHSVLEKRRFPIIDEPKYGGSRVDKM